MKRLLIGMYLLFMPVLTDAITDTNKSKKESMIQDLDVVKNYLSVKYAPKAWKKSLLGWELEDVYETARNAILNQKNATAKEYRKIFKQFLGSTEDYHVKSVCYSTASAAFPLQVKGAEGRYFIKSKELEITYHEDEIVFAIEDIEVTPELINAYNRINIGDELIAMNGMPIARVIESLMENELAGDRSATGHALAEAMLFTRLGKYGEEVPSGFFEITVLHKGEETPSSYRLPWFHAPEWIKDQDLQKLMKKQLAQFNIGNLENTKHEKLINSLAVILDKDFSVGIAKDLKRGQKFQNKLSKLKLSTGENDRDDDKEDEEESDNREKGALPPLGKLIWETDAHKELYGYLYENSNGQKIGYMYLPSFDSRGQGAEVMINEMIEFLRRVDLEGEALVIDITDNPGGMVWYMYAVLSLLTDSPLKLPTHEEILIPEDIYNAAVIYKMLGVEQVEEIFLSTLQGYVVDNSMISRMRDYAWSIIQAWESGQRMTPPIYLNGLEEIMPHPKEQFTKPIVVLTNELDFSCADFFPAILQDNKRATIFGKRTAGAGGYVSFYPHTSRFGIKGFTLTGSIAYRIDGTPIESLGVTPDVPCEVTARDLQEKYVDYIKALDTTLLQAVKRP